MGAHSAAGHGSRRTVTATAGVAAALVTTAASGLLTGGTALATDGWNGSGSDGGSGHSHRHGHSSYSGDTDSGSAAGSGLTTQAWCDVMGDVDGYSCTSEDGSADDSGSVDAATTSNAAATTHAPTPAPRPRPTSSVPDHPTVQPIVAPPGGRKVVPIAAAG